MRIAPWSTALMVLVVSCSKGGNSKEASVKTDTSIAKGTETVTDTATETATNTATNTATDTSTETGTDAELEARNAQLKAILQAAAETNDVPAMAAYVMKDGALVATEVFGVRKLGDETPATKDDLFHLGSITKSMTATVAAALVEDGKLAWDTKAVTTLASVVPNAHASFGDATLTQLLNHTGGLGGDIPSDWPTLWDYMWTSTEGELDQRKHVVKTMLEAPAVNAPGTTYLYSNAGYMVAGLMMEVVSGKTWAELMQEKIFGPLEMSCGFGVAGAAGTVDQPWPHHVVDGALTAERLDNPASIGPAGTVHCDLPSLAKYAQLHLDGVKDRAELLTKASFDAMHTVGLQSSSLGWGEGTATFAADGSNGLNYARVRVLTAKEGIVLVVSNSGTAKAAVDDVEEKILETWFE